MERRGFTLAEVMVAIAILIVVIGIALPSFMKISMAGNESAVIQAMHAVVLACESWRMQGVTAGLPASLASLTTSTPPYLDRRFRGLAAGRMWRGYTWTYTVGPERGQQVGNVLYRVLDSYTLNADPIQRGMTGQRSFFVDQTGIIRFNLRGPAGSNDQALGQNEN